ncbi:MAG: hypothetical protein Q7R49_06510 [Candidatus Daviesbacteria bacterium]|nr:hypothetical protein [Candidatus Daviesbacteria bacterium]
MQQEVKKIVYSLVFKDSTLTRKKQTPEQVLYRLRRRTVYRGEVKAYEVLATLKGSERLALEGVFGKKFPITFERGEQDSIRETLSTILDLRHSANGIN